MTTGIPVGPTACRGCSAGATTGMHCPGCAESASLRERLGRASNEVLRLTNQVAHLGMDLATAEALALANGEARERAEAEVAKLRVDMEEMVASAGRHTELDARLERWLERMPVLEARAAAIPEGTPADRK